MGRRDVRRGEVADKHDGTLAEGEDGVGLDLGVGGEDALGKARDDGLGEGEVLLGGCQRLGQRGCVRLGVRTSIVMTSSLSFPLSFLSPCGDVGPETDGGASDEGAAGAGVSVAGVSTEGATSSSAKTNLAAETSLLRAGMSLAPCWSRVCDAVGGDGWSWGWIMRVGGLVSSGITNLENMGFF